MEKTGNLELEPLKRIFQDLVTENNALQAYKRSLLKEKKELLKNPKIKRIYNETRREKLRSEWHCDFGIPPDPAPGDCITICWDFHGNIKQFFHSSEYTGFNAYTASYRTKMDLKQFFTPVDYYSLMNTLTKARDCPGRYYRIITTSLYKGVFREFEMRMTRCRCDGIFCLGKKIYKKSAVAAIANT